MFGGLSKKETGLLVEFLKKINEGKQNDLISVNSIDNDAIVKELNNGESNLQIPFNFVHFPYKNNKQKCNLQFKFIKFLL